MHGRRIVGRPDIFAVRRLLPHDRRQPVGIDDNGVMSEWPGVKRRLHSAGQRPRPEVDIARLDRHVALGECDGERHAGQEHIFGGIDGHFVRFRPSVQKSNRAVSAGVPGCAEIPSQ